MLIGGTYLTTVKLKLTTLWPKIDEMMKVLGWIYCNAAAAFVCTCHKDFPNMSTHLYDIFWTWELFITYEQKCTYIKVIVIQSYAGYTLFLSVTSFLLLHLTLSECNEQREINLKSQIWFLFLTEFPVKSSTISLIW